MSALETTLERPYIERAARALSKRLPGLISADHHAKRIIVSLCDTEPPKNWMGYPVVWRRSNG
jgi:hypothetical protein